MPSEPAVTRVAELRLKLLKAEAAVAALEEENRSLAEKLAKVERQRADFKRYVIPFVKLVNAVRQPAEDAGGRELVRSMLAQGVAPTYRIRDMGVTLGQLRTIHDVLEWWDANRP